MSDAPHTRTGYTTVDPDAGEQAKPCYPDPVMDAVRRCAELERELAAARETNRKLHRRTQAAEAFRDACVGVADNWSNYIYTFRGRPRPAVIDRESQRYGEACGAGLVRYEVARIMRRHYHRAAREFGLLPTSET